MAERSVLRLDSRAAVLAAIEEADRLGRDAFLEKYGFGEAATYFLEYNGELYDSKAIAAVAFGYQFPALGALRNDELSGGLSSAVRPLRSLGFAVRGRRPVQDTIFRDWPFLPGDQVRRKELHDRFGGSRQDGVSPSSQTPNVFLFSDPSSGEQHGYIDRWGSDGTFYYTGRGQRGNQTFTSGNAAILNHRQEGRALRVFKGASGTVTYVGEFELPPTEAYVIRKAPETGGGPLRDVIVFRLVPVDVVAASSDRVVPADEIGGVYQVEDAAVSPFTSPRWLAMSPDAYGRGLRAHRSVQNQLASEVADAGLKPLSPSISDPSFDLAWWRGDQLVLVEIKSVTKQNEVGQLRLALGQVLDYAHALRSRGIRVDPVVAVERAPVSAHWEPLFRENGVSLVWPETWRSVIERSRGTGQ